MSILLRPGCSASCVLAIIALAAVPCLLCSKGFNIVNESTIHRFSYFKISNNAIWENFTDQNTKRHRFCIDFCNFKESFKMIQWKNKSIDKLSNAELHSALREAITYNLSPSEFRYTNELVFSFAAGTFLGVVLAMLAMTVGAAW